MSEALSLKRFLLTKMKQYPFALVEKGEIPFQAEILEGFGSVDTSRTLFTIGEHPVDSNRIVSIFYSRSPQHKGITCQVIESCYTPRVES